jgi:hypothetical protein
MSELKIINGSKNLIVCFGGMALQFGGFLPFEFLNYLSSIYNNTFDLLFYIDTDQCWYHKGFKNITNDIDETTSYLNNIILNGKYEKTLFMGTSAGGYAAILYGSLCNVNFVISFFPQTILENPINPNYANLKNIINKNTEYVLYGNKTNKNKKDLHSIYHCENIECFENVAIIKNVVINMKNLRDSGFIKAMIDGFFYTDEHLN